MPSPVTTAGVAGESSNFTGVSALEPSSCDEPTNRAQTMNALPTGILYACAMNRARTLARNYDGLCCTTLNGPDAAVIPDYYSTRTVLGVPICEKRLRIAARILSSVV